MTHGYTILVAALVLPGEGEPEAEAIAWAFDTILAIGPEDSVRAISRGDSHLLEARDAFVVPLGAGAAVRWPTAARLEVGGRADLAVLDADPRLATTAGPPAPAVRAIVRGGRVVQGTLSEIGS